MDRPLPDDGAAPDRRLPSCHPDRTSRSHHETGLSGRHHREDPAGILVAIREADRRPMRALEQPAPRPAPAEPLDASHHRWVDRGQAHPRPGDWRHRGRCRRRGGRLPSQPRRHRRSDRRDLAHRDRSPKYRRLPRLTGRDPRRLRLPRQGLRLLRRAACLRRRDLPRPRGCRDPLFAPTGPLQPAAPLRGALHGVGSRPDPAVCRHVRAVGDPRRRDVGIRPLRHRRRADRPTASTWIASLDSTDGDLCFWSGGCL